MITLSIIVLSYNTKDLLRDCLRSLEKAKKEVSFEVIVPDNASSDGSLEMVQKEFPWVRSYSTGGNLGFAAGNNTARKFTKGKYVLFLNSDTVVHVGTLKKVTEYLESHVDVGAVTCRVLLANGQLDKDTRRSFITPWIGLTHLYLKLDKFFPKSKLFGKYWYGYIPDTEEHEIDAIQGAFFFTRREILEQVGWFDEDYFLDGEDIDLSWRIKEKGWKNMYYPEITITHYKGASKGKNKKIKKDVPLAEKLKYRMAGVNSMELFVRKRLWKKNPLVFNYIILTGIKLLKLIRISKVLLFG